MEKKEIAVEKFKSGFNCAQSVTFAFSELLGISEDVALKLTSGFGSGMGRRQEVCGAVSGGIFVLNALYGRGGNDDKTKQEVIYSKVRNLMAEFELKHKTVSCSELLDGCELLTPEGQERFKSNNMILKCHDYVRSIVDIIDGMIDENVM